MSLSLGIVKHFQTSDACGDEERCNSVPDFDFRSPSSTDNWSNQGGPSNASVPTSPPAVHFTFLKNKAYRNVMISVVCAVLAISMLFLFCYGLLLCYRRRGRRLGNSLPNGESAGSGEDDDGDNNDVVGGGGLHHVWYIRTVGLDQNTIDSIKIFPYKSGDPLMGTTNCSVCLSEFREGELVRLLPKCSHAFHISCIDTWLRSRVNCPLCRAPVVVASPPAPLAAATTTGLASCPSSSSSAPSSSSSTIVRTTSEESNPLSSEGRHNPQLPTNVATGNWAIPIACETSSRSNSVSTTAFRVLSDFGRRGGQTTARNGIPARHRSLSMDFYAMGLATEGNAWQERKEPRLGLQVPGRAGVMEKQWSGRKGACSLGMARSASTNGDGAKLFASRLGRGRSNSVLPL